MSSLMQLLLVQLILMSSLMQLLLVKLILMSSLIQLLSVRININELSNSTVTSKN